MPAWANGLMAIVFLVAVAVQHNDPDPLRRTAITDVTVVDLQAVRFLRACEAEGLRLLHCPPYIREWIRILDPLGTE
jgi:hypothetical protein